MDTYVTKRYSIDQCRKNAKCLFIFGDSNERVGHGGTAIIRDERNAIGIRSKLKPSMDKDAFFNDDKFEENCRMIEEDITRIGEYKEEIGATSVAFPFLGIGTGLAALPLKAPKTFFYLCTRLYEEFNFNNLEGHFTI